MSRPGSRTSLGELRPRSALGPSEPPLRIVWPGLRQVGHSYPRTQLPPSSRRSTSRRPPPSGDILRVPEISIAHRSPPSMDPRDSAAPSSHALHVEAASLHCTPTSPDSQRSARSRASELSAEQPESTTAAASATPVTLKMRFIPRLCAVTAGRAKLSVSHRIRLYRGRRGVPVLLHVSQRPFASMPASLIGRVNALSLLRTPPPSGPQIREADRVSPTAPEGSKARQCRRRTDRCSPQYLSVQEHRP